MDHENSTEESDEYVGESNSSDFSVPELEETLLSDDEDIAEDFFNRRDFKTGDYTGLD
jgi:hypothetical protein